jgi:hypothetical protein
MEHVDIVAAMFRDAGFSVFVSGSNVNPRLSRRVSRAEVESVVIDLVDDGLVSVIGGCGGYWVSVHA